MAKTGSHLKIESFGDAALGVTLLGNPKKPEPDHFRVNFPGGDVDIARCTDGSYWVHVAVNRRGNGGHDPERAEGQIKDARLDIIGKCAADCDAGDFGHEGLYHLAVRVEVPAAGRAKR